MAKTRSAANEVFDEIEVDRPSEVEPLVKVISDLKEHVSAMIAESNGKTDELEAKILLLQKTLGQTGNALAEMTKQKDQTVDLLEQKTAEYGILEDNLASVQKELQDAISEKEEIIAQLQAELETLRNQLQAAGEHSAGLEVQIGTLSAEIEALKAQIAELEQKLADSDSALDSANGQN